MRRSKMLWDKLLIKLTNAECCPFTTILTRPSDVISDVHNRSVYISRSTANHLGTLGPRELTNLGILGHLDHAILNRAMEVFCDTAPDIRKRFDLV